MEGMVYCMFTGERGCGGGRGPRSGIPRVGQGWMEYTALVGASPKRVRSIAGGVSPLVT